MGEGYIRIAASCIIIYLFIVVFIRLFGKKELAQLSVVDLVFILLISNAVQNAMVGSNSSLTGGLVAATSLFLINYIFKWLMYKFPKFSGAIQGSPLLLVYKGDVNLKNLRKAQLSVSELKEAMREHGVADVKEINLAVLETDGNISIISNDFSHQTLKKRITNKDFSI